jgi:hypothetical protein
MNEQDIDEILGRAAKGPHPVDPRLLDRVSASIGATLRPVRPIAPVWVLASALWLVSAGIAIAAAWALGLNGVQKLTGTEMGAIFPVLALFTWLAALLSVGAMTPGALRWNPARLLIVVIVAWIAVDAILFRDYRMASFVPEGFPCLRAGLLIAIPAGAASWLVLQRGFAVNRIAAGLAAGTLAGLAGLTMLEFHCANFNAMHVMVWHTAVVPVSGLAGAMLARWQGQKQVLAADERR